MAILWLAAAVMFVPVIFWNALRWIRDEEDPDVELYQLTRRDRLASPGPASRPDGDVAPAP